MEWGATPLRRGRGMTSCRPWVIVGNPENRRVGLFQEALASRRRRPAEVVSYHSLLQGTGTLGQVPQDSVVRWESPGENFLVEKQLLRAGVVEAEREGNAFLSLEELNELADDHGRILFPRQTYLGYIASIKKWTSMLLERTDVTRTSSVHDLEVIGDKTLTNLRCRDHEVPVPDALGNVANWDELVAQLEQSGHERVFVKLANSSSASGVVALNYGKGRMQAITSTEMVTHRGEVLLYNSLKLRRYSQLNEVRDLVNALARHRVHVEAWLPKAAVDRRVCDLRVVVIAGEPRHMVLRTSRSPITNLHLGNRRGDVDAFWNRIPPSERDAILETCRRCARLFPDSLHLGLDILLTPGFRQHRLLEVNAFGDLLPGVLHDGKSTYEAEIEAVSSC